MHTAASVNGCHARRLDWNGAWLLLSQAPVLDPRTQYLPLFRGRRFTGTQTLGQPQLCDMNLQQVLSRSICNGGQQDKFAIASQETLTTKMSFHIYALGMYAIDPFRHFILFRPAHAMRTLSVVLTKLNLTVAIEPQSTDTYMDKNLLPSYQGKIIYGPRIPGFFMAYSETVQQLRDGQFETSQSSRQA